MQLHLRHHEHEERKYADVKREHQREVGPRRHSWLVEWYRLDVYKRQVVERVCDRVIVLAKGKVVADAAPRELTELMHLPTLESVFAQLVQQTDTGQVAREIVDVMKVRHG